MEGLWRDSEGFRNSGCQKSFRAKILKLRFRSRA